MLRRTMKSLPLAIGLFCWSPLGFGAGVGMPDAFFDKQPYIPPKIIQDLATWESDKGDQVVAINLADSVNSNRYFGEIKTAGGGTPFVFSDEPDQCSDDPCRANPPRFGYRLIGRTPSGVYVLFTESSGGGSGRFRGLMFATVVRDKGLANYVPGAKVLRLDRERWLVRKLGELPLGDRYEGAISLQGNMLHVSRDEYSPSAGFFKEDVVLSIAGLR